MALLFPTAMKEFLTDNNLLWELIRIDNVEAICFQKEDIQLVITKNLCTTETRNLIAAIATKAQTCQCQTFQQT